MRNSALIVIDIQNEYFEDGGMELVDPLKAGMNARRVIDQFRREKLPVVHIQHISSDPKAMP
ncbi:MAG TPA: cysteine hydrolase, partial [Sphingobacterium sp.]|nr:cysteine hydrolase [Sphingobacterium sp.]